MLYFLLFIFPLIHGRYWEKHYLTYSIENNTFLANEINEAVMKWNVPSLEFKRVDSGKGDIKISFIPFNHNSSVLGMARYPPVGIIHINENLKGEDLKSVVMHEFGHALGLEHIFNITSIMYPIFMGEKKVSTQDNLFLNDVYRCRYDSVTLLNYYTYLKFQGTHYKRIDFNTGYTSEDKLWHPSIVKVDAMYRNHSYFIISDQDYYKFNIRMSFVEKGSIQSLFPNIRGRIEAVLTLHNGSIIVFLNDKRIWRNDRVFPNRWYSPESRIQGAYQLLNKNIVLNAQNTIWLYDKDFNFIGNINICGGTLGKVHCCNKYSTM